MKKVGLMLYRKIRKRPVVFRQVLAAGYVFSMSPDPDSFSKSGG